MSAIADIVAGAIKLGTAVVDALKRAPRAVLRAVKPRPRVHVPTQAEREAARRRP